MLLRLVVGALVLAVVTWWAFREPEPETSAPGVRVAASSVYNPVAAGETLPDGFRQLLPRDAIFPIYDPEFVAAADSGWRGESQVIGVAIGGEAKAYPVSYLSQREMVIDQIAGDPILVSW